MNAGAGRASTRSLKGQTDKFKGICEASFALHLLKQQQRQRLPETTFPLERPCTGSANPSVHSDPFISKVANYFTSFGVQSNRNLNKIIAAIFDVYGNRRLRRERAKRKEGGGDHAIEITRLLSPSPHPPLSCQK